MTIVGMDLGTTNSACGVWKDGRVQMIPNRLGDYLTPSVVHIDTDKKATVGKTAREKLIPQPNATTALFKRYMGTERKIRLNRQPFTAPELSAFVLRSLKEDAEAFLNEPLTEAVVSVPAYFSDAQRKATIQASEIVGLKVDRLINEPTAAAMAYGLHEKPEHTQFMVIDLGGGTFDVSIMEYFDGVLEVHASAGDNFLGGEDFLDLLVQKYLVSSSLNKDSLEKSELNQLYQQMELAKRELNAADQIVVAPFLRKQPDEVVLNASDFEKMSLPLLKRIQRPVETALRDANINPTDLDDVLLVGGATRMKLLRSTVARMFRRMPSANLDPDLVVAMGAAIQAGLKSRDAALDDVVLTDVCPYSLGIGMHNHSDSAGLQGALYDPIIERNTIVPVSREQYYSTVENNQAAINIDIYQGESRLAKNNIKLGGIKINVPAAKAGEERIVVRFSYDINGLLEVDVTVSSTEEKVNKVIENAPGSLSAEEISNSQSKLSALKFHPREQEINRELIARAERLYEGRLSEERAIIRELLTNFEVALETQDERMVEVARTEFIARLEHFDRPFFV